MFREGPGPHETVSRGTGPPFRVGASREDVAGGKTR
jgi:hypothetical protein